MTFSLRSVLAAASLACVLLACCAPAVVMADTPANCTYGEFLGAWNVSVSVEMPAPTEPSLRCTSVFTVDYDVSLQLTQPNHAQVNNGPTGNWTLIYNQGIEVWVGDAKLFSYSNYDSAGDDLCGQSVSAWFHERSSTGGKDVWRCAKLTKLPREDDSAEVQTARAASLRSPQHVPRDVAAVNAQLRAARVADPERLSSVFTTDHEFLAQVNKAAGGMFTVKHYPELDGLSVGALERRRGTVMPVATPEEMLAPAIVKESSKCSRASADADTADIPASFDWRNVSGVNFVSPVRDQGQCGSCYIFSSAGQLESRIRIKSNNKQQPILSTQDPIQCSTYSQGCGGGFPYLIAGKYAFDYGFTEEACNPYTGLDGACALNNTEVCNDRWTVDGYEYVGGYYGASSEQRMQEEIFNNGPISIGIMVYDDLMNYAGGVYTHKFAAELELDDFNPFVLVNHAVLAVGWGVSDDEAKTPYWIVKNSWGGAWGEKGYFRVLRSSDQSAGGECGVQSLTVAASPVLH